MLGCRVRRRNSGCPRERAWFPYQTIGNHEDGLCRFTESVPNSWNSSRTFNIQRFVVPQLICPTYKCTKTTLAKVPSGTKKETSKIVTHSYRMVDTKTLNKYKCVLALFMLFIHGRSEGIIYARNYVHSVVVLAVVTPQDGVERRYMNLKTYGTMFPAPDANSFSRRGTTLGFDKKANSFFMPN